MRCPATDVPLLGAYGKLVSAHILRKGLLTSLGCRKSLLYVYLLNQRISDDIGSLMSFGSGQITRHGRDLPESIEHQKSSSTNLRILGF